MIAKFFIDRPVLANVLALLILLLGAVAAMGLPVSQYPQLTPPTIQVSASYPGANAKTVQEVVGRAIEHEVNGVAGMLYMQSNASNDGRYVLTVSFTVGTNTDQAQIAVQNRVAIAVPLLPSAVQQQGVVTKTKSTAILQMITLSSDDPNHDSLFLSNFASLQLRDRLMRIPGVADVNVFGVGQYAMRVWLNASQMRQRSLVPSQIINVLSQQNQRISAGQIGAPPAAEGQDLQLTVTVDSPLTNPRDFGDLIVNTASDGSIVRLRDVAHIELGSQSYTQEFRYDGKPSGGIAIYQLPDANALDTSKAVSDELTKASASFPKGMRHDIALDTTVFVKASIDEVYSTLFEAGILVLIVILVFLQDWRATLVPATTVPITIVGAFAFMALLGFSINLLTLFAIVLCIGIVVDDAIVVVEGVAQRMSSDKTARQAATEAMGELMGPIIGITLVLTAVFLPAAFIPGITGQMYRQFALVIAATAVLSGINAITLKPTQSAQYLRMPDASRPPNAFSRVFNAAFAKTENSYIGFIEKLIQHKGSTALIAALLIGVAGYGFLTIPTAFIPTEDQGYMMVAVQLPDGASLERTTTALNKVVQVARATPGVAHAIAISGISPVDGNASLSNAGLVYLVLDDWSKRNSSPDQGLLKIYQKLTTDLAEIPDASSRVLVPPPINGLGLSGGFQMQLLLTDGSADYGKLSAAADAVVAAASADPRIQLAFTTLRVSVPQIKLEVNRARAETLGVSVGDAYSAIQTYLGSSYVNQFSKFGQNYSVYVQADASNRRDLQTIGQLTVRSKSGDMVPLSAFAELIPTFGPAVASQYNLYPTAPLLGASVAGVSSGDALKILEKIAEEKLPPGVSYAWTAMSYQEKLAGGAVGLVFALAILLVYFVLAGQYESWLAPVPVLLAVPLSLVGTVSALMAVNLPNNIYVQIGLVLLIALSAKNAILIVEVARELHQHGMDIVNAALEASRRRFRPILMTSFAFILGVVPLITSSGAGAAARKSIGITVFSGMLSSTILAVTLVPVFYVLVAQWQARMSGGIKKLHPID